MNDLIVNTTDGRKGASYGVDSHQKDIQKLLERLSEFELSKCVMKHEVILRESKGHTPVLNTMIDHGFQRRTYCNPEIRLRRLACDHITARAILVDSLEYIPDSACCQPKLKQWKSSISKLNLSII